MKVSVISIGALVVALAALAAQEPKPAFDVASLKRNTLGAPGPGGGPGSIERFRPDGLSYNNATLPMLMRTAYGVRPEWIVGGPEWAFTDRFDVIAKAARPASRDEIRLMLRSMLEDRFKLVVATEKRERPAYVLRLNRADGRLGADLRRSSDDCEAKEKADPLAFTRQMLQTRMSDGARPSMMEACETMAIVAVFLERTLSATVIDETGLTGNWDWAISYASQGPPTISVAGNQAPQQPSIFLALQEQLGLKLDRRQEPGFYEVLVIKSAELPSEN